MNAWSGITLAIQLLIVAAMLWWVYALGIAMAVAVFFIARNRRLKRWAMASLAAQFAPVVLFVLVFPIGLIEIAVNRALPNTIVTWVSVIAMGVGPLLSVLLVMRLAVGLLASVLSRTSKREGPGVLHSVPFMLGACLVLAACGEPASEPADAPATPDVQPTAVADPAALGEAARATVCQAGVGAVYGQSGADVLVLDRAGDIVTVGWRAPVDGGQLTAECRIEGDRVLWRPLDRPVAGENRWMDQPEDPVVTYALDGSTLTVSQRMPDGTTTTTVQAVTSEEEAR